MRQCRGVRLNLTALPPPPPRRNRGIIFSKLNLLPNSCGGSVQSFCLDLLLLLRLTELAPLLLLVVVLSAVKESVSLSLMQFSVLALNPPSPVALSKVLVTQGDKKSCSFAQLFSLLLGCVNATL
jgi:hypothetical protein